MATFNKRITELSKYSLLSFLTIRECRYAYDEPYFTDRVEELARIGQFLKSKNHLVLISPRRYGKSSLVRKAVRESGRPYVWVNMQQVLSREDFAAKLLKSIFKQYKMEKVKHFLRNFRVLPSVSVNPMTDEMSVTFQPLVDSQAVFEDSMALLGEVSSAEHRLVVVFDEFQDILEIDKHIDRELRAIMQEQANINYILLGSQESMMTDIFERPKSPFYHFGMLMRLSKIPQKDFLRYLQDRLSPVTVNSEDIARKILSFTDNHPYYTQQLASAIWGLIALGKGDADVFDNAIADIVQAHDLDYERLWLTFNKTDQLMIRLVCQGSNPVKSRMLPTSTMTSSLKRLAQKGYIINREKDDYAMEDPFFKKWIVQQQQL